MARNKGCYEPMAKARVEVQPPNGDPDPSNDSRMRSEGFPFISGGLRGAAPEFATVRNRPRRGDKQACAIGIRRGEVLLRSVAQKCQFSKQCCSEVSFRSVDEQCGSEVLVRSVAQNCG